ncbi:DUF2288 domain-containing protein [Pseudomonas sp. R5(2019)]|uniref:DUF2288 domain-containing protein n=1 Tax=Pseudomonas sp. R5(2019) TaxID=2697566 RepID=UPI0014127FD8|nr:DUF2288 domain-containing protein [Pseudomonas sp. R5(2019)]NBA94619.1 DUF2288 family protein [Pseudomonas sp. R5(2019)]
MTEQPSTLYAKLLGETAVITWKELEPFFARGDLFWVAPTLDLIAVAEAVAEDRKDIVAQWLKAETFAKLSAEQALSLCEDKYEIWAVVLRPLILIQVRNHA